MYVYTHKTDAFMSVDRPGQSAPAKTSLCPPRQDVKTGDLTDTRMDSAKRNGPNCRNPRRPQHFYVGNNNNDITRVKYE